MLPLPIDDLLPDILAEAGRAKRLVLIAPPGAGKTTRVPAALARSSLLRSPRGRVVLLQPRRVAARAAATRIADDNGWTLGEQVGYHVRFDRRDGPRSIVQVLTEGILARRLIDDPFLEDVGAVILDEFHERSIHSDLALALLRDVQDGGRDDLILIVMSATLDAEPVARYLGDCPIIRAEGRAYPIELIYRPAAGATPLQDQVFDAVLEALRGSDDPGDLLVFLPGMEEIRRAARRVEPLAAAEGCVALPLHGSLSALEQDRALRPSDRRKIVLATNVAETSLTIDGVATVIDSGLARVPRFDPRRGLDRLELTRISKASAIQRAGRAGRTRAGRCVRLWSTRDERGMPETETPDIQRIDLSATLLALHAWGHADPRRFPWFEAPPPETLNAAEALLTMLGALEAGRLTSIGRELLRLPVAPRLARLLVASARVGLLREGATLAALLSEKDIVPPVDPRAPIAGRPIRRGRSDWLDRLDLIENAERRGFSPAIRAVVRARDDLMRHARRFQSSHAIDPDQKEEELLKLVLLAYPDRVCRRRGAGSEKGVMVGGQGVRLSPESVVRDAEFFLALDAREERRGGIVEAKVRIASAIEPEWLEEAFPHQIETERAVRFDVERERVVGVATVRYRDLALRESPHAVVDADEAGIVLGAALSARAEEFVRSNEGAARRLDRLEFLRRWMPECDWPAIDLEVLAELVRNACLGLRSTAEAREVELAPLIEGLLTPAQSRALREHAPETMEVPSGQRHRLVYESGRPPVLAVRLQELFGWTETPRIAQGRVALLIHLLGPNYRPVQITDDLHSFWTSAYFQVRKDLRSRYPKHAWPEDPFTAKPEAKGSRTRLI